MIVVIPLHIKKECLKESKYKNQFYCKDGLPVPENNKKDKKQPSEKYVSKVDEVFKCGKCGITSRSKYNITGHIERKHEESERNQGGSDATEDVTTSNVITRIEQQQDSLKDILKYQIVPTL